MSFTECLTVYRFGTRLTNTPSVSHWKLYVFYMKITSECFEFEQLNGQHARASPAHTDTGGIVLLLIFQPCLNSLHNGAIFLKNNSAFKFLLLPSQGYYNSTYTFYFLTTNAKTRGKKTRLIPDWICQPCTWPQAETRCCNFTPKRGWCYGTLSLWRGYSKFPLLQDAAHNDQICPIFLAWLHRPHVMNDLLKRQKTGPVVIDDLN